MDAKDDINELIKSLVEETKESTFANIPTKLASKNKKFEGRRCKVHKYIKFSKNNKTYDTTKYYCVKCSSRIDMDMILGRSTECWKCGSSFKVKIGYFANKPLCDSCQGTRINKTKDEILDLITEKL